jgi:hypothetical protein
MAGWAAHPPPGVQLKPSADVSPADAIAAKQQHPTAATSAIFLNMRTSFRKKVP